MKEVTLKIPDNKYPFFIELIKSLDFMSLGQIEESQEGDTKEEIVENLTQGFKELKLYEEGKIKFRNAQDTTDEL